MRRLLEAFKSGLVEAKAGGIVGQEKPEVKLWLRPCLFSVLSLRKGTTRVAGGGGARLMSCNREREQ